MEVHCATVVAVNEILRLWGRNIEFGRKAVGLTQEQLATCVGVSRQAVGTWEAGQSAPTDAHRVRIAEVLHQDVYRLFPLTRRPIIEDSA
jgi:transcriptional regulator with XRE-family HTH domain